MSLRLALMTVYFLVMNSKSCNNILPLSHSLISIIWCQSAKSLTDHETHVWKFWVPTPNGGARWERIWCTLVYDTWNWDLKIGKRSGSARPRVNKKIFFRCCGVSLKLTTYLGDPTCLPLEKTCRCPREHVSKHKLGTNHLYVMFTLGHDNIIAMTKFYYAWCSPIF